jgi:hypothetical protein
VLDDKGVLRTGPRGARVWVEIYPLKPAQAQASRATFPTHWGRKGSRLWCITRLVEIDAAAAGCPLHRMDSSRSGRLGQGWVTNTLGEFSWSGQRRMAQSMVENRYSSFKASHDVSKAHTMSTLALWWIQVHPPGEAFVVTTAPTTPQVEAILWRYTSNDHNKGGLPGRITLDAKWHIGNELVAYGGRLTMTPQPFRAYTLGTYW